MIGYLRGLVVDREAAGDHGAELLVDVGGVGYRVLTTPRVASGVVVGDGEATLFVYTHVREGAITLYGFSSAGDRRAFELLLGAHGVGPGLALAICSALTPDRLAEIVTAGDVDGLCVVPGIGKKTATRLIVELKSRFDQALLTPAELGLVPGEGAPSVRADVTEALAQLGYAPDEIRSVVGTLPREGSAPELLRVALRELAPRR